MVYLTHARRLFAGCPSVHCHAQTRHRRPFEALHPRSFRSSRRLTTQSSMSQRAFRCSTRPAVQRTARTYNRLPRQAGFDDEQLHADLGPDEIWHRLRRICCPRAWCGCTSDEAKQKLAALCDGSQPAEKILSAPVTGDHRDTTSTITSSCLGSSRTLMRRAGSMATMKAAA